MTIHEHLLDVGPYHSKACVEAREWAAQYQTAQEVWDNCTRVDWLFWWAARMGQARKVAVCAKEIAQSVAHLQEYSACVTADAAVNAASHANEAAAAVAGKYYFVGTAYHAADASDDATYAAATIGAEEKQRALNLSIARRHLVCPWHEPQSGQSNL